MDFEACVVFQVENLPSDHSILVRIDCPSTEGLSLPDGSYLLGYDGVCTHMGCVLPISDDSTQGEAHYSENTSAESVAFTYGPCPCHGTTFDLSKSGLVVLGPATQNLPQLKLEIRGDDVICSGWLNDGRTQHGPPSGEQWPCNNKNWRRQAHE